MTHERVRVTNISDSVEIGDFKIVGDETGKFIKINDDNEAEWVNIIPADISAASADIEQVLTVNADNVGEWQDNFHAAALKVHRVGTLVLTNPNVWEDITFNLKVADETTDDFHYYDEGGAGEDTSIIVCESTGIFWVGGCVHSYWNNAVGGVHDTASRVIISQDNGSSWDEPRCLQALSSANRVLADYLTNPYTGTIYVESGDWLKLQVWVDDINVELRGSAIFDNPVVATLGIYGVVK